MAGRHDMAMALRVAYWAMHRQTDAILASRRVTADQFVLMSLLAEEDQVTQQQLVRRASSDANTVRAMLLLLEERGLVSRGPHPTDGRARSVALTGKGRQIYQRLVSQSEPVRQRMMSAVGADHADGLVDGLKRIAEAMAPAGRRLRQSRMKAVSNHVPC